MSDPQRSPLDADSALRYYVPEIERVRVVRPLRPMTRRFVNVVVIRPVIDGYRAQIVNVMPPLYISPAHRSYDACAQQAADLGYLIVELEERDA